MSNRVATLCREVRAVLEQARSSAYRTVNIAMVRAYWNVGGLIFEHEQKGEARATYGEAVLEELSHRLTAEFGRGATSLTCARCDSFTECSRFETQCVSNQAGRNETRRVSFPRWRRFGTRCVMN